MKSIISRLMAVLFIAGAASVALAGGAVGAPGHVAGGAAGRPTLSAMGMASQENSAASGGPLTCFRADASANCVSADPKLSFSLFSNGDTTGCSFDLTIDWGDNSGTTQDPITGGPNGSQFGPFSHTYNQPGTYAVTWTGTLVSNTGPNNCVSSSAAGSFTYFPCPGIGKTADATLPAITAKITGIKISGAISYGQLPLTFTSRAPAADALCSVQSNNGALPVKLFGGTVLHSATVATVEFVPADTPSTQVPACTFAGLQGLANVDATPPLSALAAANNCLLTSSAHAPTGVIARWSSPGFNVMAGSTVLHTTDPLTFYVDLGALGGPAWSTASFGETLQAVEEYIHIKLVDNLPMIDKLAMWVDPPADLSITDPQGQTVGLISGGKVRSFPGAGYATVGKASVAWLIDPTAGSYSATASGPAGEAFTTNFAVLQCLGHGAAPLTRVSVWKGKLGGHGTSASRFAVHGSSLTPVILAHESAAKARQKATIKFNLTGSVIPYGPATITWTFGDGTKATGSSVTHAYQKPGRYTPKVTVRNKLGATVTVQLPAITVTR
jgi:hypothetical protein